VELAMAATGLDVFDKSLQATNTMLQEIMGSLGPDRQVAWHALGAVLHAVRDRVPIDEAAHLGAQLPLVVRGLYYDRWHPAGKPDKQRSEDEFLARVDAELQGGRPVNSRDATKAVFATLSRHLPAGQVEKVKHTLPAPIRSLWSDGASPTGG
jgi:uncharacterized protein (DUF2267 family)